MIFRTFPLVHFGYDIYSHYLVFFRFVLIAFAILNQIIFIHVFKPIISTPLFLFRFFHSYSPLFYFEYTGMKKEARLAGADAAVDPSAGKKKI